MIIAAYNLVVALLVFGVVRQLHRRRAQLSAGLVVVAALATIGSAVVLATSAFLLRPEFSGFFGLRLMAYAVFLHSPLFLVAAAWVVRREQSALAAFGATVAALIIGIGIHAFLIEPSRLQLTRYTVESPRLREPLRIAVLADIQTDVIGEHERRAVEWAMASEPDLVLLPGDFIQTSNKREPVEVEKHARLGRELAALFEELEVDAPLGAFAVQGDIDGPRWADIFDGLTIEAKPGRETFEIRDDVLLTTLPIETSHNTTTHVARPHSAPLHVVVGHGPNFALSVDVDADLLIAGHTHGGQVQLPIIGPLLTLSRVPRAWAAGALTRLSSGATLIVSKGIGMERGAAPRLRFLCPPEVVIVDVVPAAGALPEAGERRAR